MGSTSSTNLSHLSSPLFWPQSFPGDSGVKSPPDNAGDISLIPGWEDPLEEEMATHSLILAWKIPWTEDPVRLQSTGLQKELDIATGQQQLWASSHWLGSSQTMLMFGRTALKHVYYQVWNTSPVQVGCMKWVLRTGALGWPRGMGCGGRWEGGSGWGTNVNPWLIHVNVWQKPLQYCKVISL